MYRGGVLKEKGRSIILYLFLCLVGFLIVFPI